jgi:serine protease inhibitor
VRKTIDLKEKGGVNLKKLIVPLIVMSFLILVIIPGTFNKQEGSGFSINGDFNKDDYKKIIFSNNQLGFDLLADARADKNGNIFISPTSLLMALSMVYNGANGVTKEEMADVFHAEGIEENQLNKANASLMSILHSDSKHSQLNVANSIWLNNHFHFQDVFAQNNRDYYNAKIQQMDLTSSKTLQIINNWVKKSTNGKITKIIGRADLDSNTVSILINAIYFKGDWMHEFDKKHTEKRTFHLEDKTSKVMQMMTLTEKLSYLENEDFQAVTLPYTKGKMSMIVFLPSEGTSLEEFKKMLTNDNWEKWRSEFHEKEGTVQLPKFHLAYEAELSEVLKKLGMTTAFNENEANFTKMIKESRQVWISKIKQKTFINVNEEGSEAAAATLVKMKTKSAPLTAPFYMDINRPFFMAITDHKTGAILFMGAISNPQKRN